MTRRRRNMRLTRFLLTISIFFFIPCFVYGQDKGKTISITAEEQQAITQAFISKQQAQAKVAELKKLRDALLQPIEAAIKQAEAEDANALMAFQNIELKIGNSHSFDPAKYDKSEKDGKLVYIEKKEPEKPKEGK